MCCRVLHHDDRIIVLDKPSGLLSVPGMGPEKTDCLATRVAARHAGARIVHRLDRDTSGVIVMALDAEAHRELSRQFQDREVDKVYVAVAFGPIDGESGEIDLPIRKERHGSPLQVIDPEKGRPALTRWRVLERGDERTRVELRPRTGRSHQLRLHMKAIDHPILGDDLYAPPHIVAMAVRLLLHACSLSIVHPATAEPMTFESACPF